jgi:protein SCO1/2
MTRRVLLTLAVGVVLGAAGRAGAEVPTPLREVSFDQKLDQQVPLDLEFRDDTGGRVRLRDSFDGKPVILVLAYYRCPKLCNEVLNGLVRSLLDVPLDLGRDFNVVTVSFDPREQPELAAAKKAHYLERYGRARDARAWRFLTGEEEPIRRLADSVGFRYRYDPRTDQYAHASGIVVLTPDGRTSRYFYGIKFAPRDLRLGLVDASGGKIGSPVDRVLLYCFHYDPSVGKYGVTIMNLVRLGGVLTMIGIGVLWFVLWRMGPRQEPDAPAKPTPGAT